MSNRNKAWFTIGLLAVTAVIWLLRVRSRPQLEEHANAALETASSRKADNRTPRPAPSEVSSTFDQVGELAQVADMPAIPIVDDELARELRLMEAERQKLESLTQRWRSKMTAILAASAKVDRPSPNACVLNVLLPEASSVALRAAFYGDLQSEFGSARSEAMRMAYQFGRIEGNLFDFGEFATRIEITGDGESIATSRTVRVLVASDMIKRTPSGHLTRNPEVEAVWSIAMFRWFYGDLATLALSPSH